MFLPVEKWEKKLKKYQYVVLFHTNEMFKRTYAGLFEKPETIEEGSVYQVKSEGDHISLKYIGKTGIKNFR